MGEADRFVGSPGLCRNLGFGTHPQRTGQNRGGENDGEDENSMRRAFSGRRAQ
jgi:hypothetical protein